MPDHTISGGRRAAVEILREVSRGKLLDAAFADVALTLAERDRAWVQDLVYGTIRLRGRIDHILDAHLQRGTESVPPAVLDLLRLGTYQLLHMDSVPAYAAVSQAVEQAREVSGRGMGGLANAVLRVVSRKGEDRSLFPERDPDPLGYLSSWHSHPRWLVERWLARWDVDDVERLLQSNNEVPFTWLLPLEHEPEAAVEKLRGAGIAAEVQDGEAGSVRLERGASPAEALAAVPGIIQDPAATLVALHVDPEPGALIADLCAAPGGKALALSRGGSYLIAADRSSSRIRRVRENVQRIAGDVPGRIGLVVGRAEQPPLRSAPVVLLDVPCSGTGTFGRHPDGRWRLRPADVTALAALQKEMLEGACSIVEPGGLLVYATCTLEPEENEDQIDSFLEGHADFRLEPPTGVTLEHLDSRGFLRILPQNTEFDGAFAARLRRDT